MKNLFNLSSEEEKNRIRGLHLTESKDKRITSVLSEQSQKWYTAKEQICMAVSFESGQAKVSITDFRSGNKWNFDDAKLYSGINRLLEGE